MNFSTKTDQYNNPVRRLEFRDATKSDSLEYDSDSMNLEELLNKISEHENKLLGRKQLATNQPKTKEEASQAPRYLLPTTASSLPPYLHSESERVRNSYRTGSYHTLKKLPDKLDCGQIDLHRKQHVIENLITLPEQTFRPAAACKSQTFFNSFQHVGTDYEKETLLHKDLIEEEKLRIDSYARKPFVTSSRIRSKYEEMGNDAGPMIANLGPGGDCKRLEMLTRDDLLNEEKYIFGRFNVFGGGGKMPTNAVSQHKKQFFLSIKKRLTAQLQKDFPDIPFRIRWSNENQEVLVQFSVPSELVRLNVPRKKHKAKAIQATEGPDQSEGLGALELGQGFPVTVLTKYMHRVVNHGLGFEFALQKRGNCWGQVTRDYPTTSEDHTLLFDTIATNTNDHNDSDDHSLSLAMSSSSKLIRLRSLEDAGFDSSLPTMMNQDFTEEAIQAHVARMISNLQLEEAKASPNPANSNPSKPKHANHDHIHNPTPTTPHPKAAITTNANNTNVNYNSRTSYSLRPALTTMLEEAEDEDDLASRLTSGTSVRLSRSARSGSRSQRSLVVEVGSLSGAGSFSAPSLLRRSDAFAGTTSPPASSPRDTLPAQSLPVAYFLTYAMCAPWVNSVTQSIHQREAAKHRAQAKVYRQYRQQKYSLLAPLPAALTINTSTFDAVGPGPANDSYIADPPVLAPGLSMANMFMSSLAGNDIGPLRKSALMQHSSNPRSNSINAHNNNNNNNNTSSSAMNAGNVRVSQILNNGKPMSVRSILLSPN